MKKTLYLLVLFFLPLLCFSQTLFRSGTFLHHSTGLNIWGPNGSSTSIPLQITAYNTSHGYSGTNAVAMGQQWWPSGGDNEWEYWHRIFDNQVYGVSIVPVMNINKIVVVKSCFPSSEMTGWGQAADTLIYTRKSVYNYKWHWRHIINVMAQRPQNFFVLWTNAPHVQGNTNSNAAMLAKKFTTWAKDTLAQGLDPVMGAFPPNVYVFNYFAKLTDANGYELPQYAVSSYDSHPNGVATALIAPQFVNEIFNAAIAYEQGGSVLSVTPLSRNVTSTAGVTSFSVSCTTNWTASSNVSWCTTTLAGSGNGTITANYTTNSGTTARTATITVSATGVPSQTVTVIQSGFVPALTVTPTNQNVTSLAGSTSFSVASNTSWTVLDNATWLTATSSGSGNGTITANYTANTATTARTATITVSAAGAANQTVTVIQSGFVPALTITPSNQYVTSLVGSTSFSVTSNTSWTVLDNVTWLTATSSGSGNGTITANYTANSGTTARTAIITVSAAGVANQTVTVIQSGLAPAFTVTPSNQNVTALAGSTSFSVISNTSWTLLDNASWLTATSSGSGNGTITANYTANTGSTVRIATMTISATGVGEFTITVTQATAYTESTLTVTPSNQNVTSTAGTTSFAITSNTIWSATSNAAWCTVTAAGSGNGTIVAAYSANTGSASRIATITISATGVSNRIVTVNQSGYSSTVLIINPGFQMVSGAAGTTAFTVTSNTTWSAVSYSSWWCSVTPSGTGNGTIIANYTMNPKVTSRTATIKISAAGVISQIVTVTQAGSLPFLTVTPSGQYAAVAAGSKVFTVKSNTNWTAQSNSSWCTVTPSGFGNGVINTTYTTNTGAMRVATITVSAAGVSNRIVTLTQYGVAGKQSDVFENLSFSYHAGNYIIPGDLIKDYTVQSNSGWCKIVSSNADNDNVIITFEENMLAIDRIALITVFTGSSEPMTFSLVQSGRSTNPVLADQMNVQLFPNPSEGIFKLLITNNDKKVIQVIISDLLGRRVYSKTFSGDVSEDIDLNKEGRGFFEVMVSSENSIQRRSIIIQ